MDNTKTIEEIMGLAGQIRVIPPYYDRYAQNTTIGMVRGPVVNGMDHLPHEYNGRLEIDSVSTGMGVYQDGRDYRLEGNYIHWLPGGRQPLIGASYEVYGKVFGQVVPPPDEFECTLSLAAELEALHRCVTIAPLWEGVDVARIWTNE